MRPRTSKFPAPISLAVRAMRPRRRAVSVAISRPSAAPTPKAIRADSTYSVWITPRRCAQLGAERVGHECRSGSAMDRQPDGERRAVVAALRVPGAGQGGARARRRRAGRLVQLWPSERRSEIRRPSESKTKTATRRLFEISIAWRATAAAARVGSQRIRGGDAVADRELHAVAAEGALGIPAEQRDDGDGGESCDPRECEPEPPAHAHEAGRNPSHRAILAQTRVAARRGRRLLKVS